MFQECLCYFSVPVIKDTDNRKFSKKGLERAGTSQGRQIAETGAVFRMISFSSTHTGTRQRSNISGEKLQTIHVMCFFQGASLSQIP